MPDVKEKLLTGYEAGDMTYKVHLDGYNLLPYLTGRGAEGPAQGVLLFLRRRRPDRPALRQLEVRVPGAAGDRERCRSGPSRSRVCACRRSSICGSIPTSARDITSNTYYDWLLDHAFMLVPAQKYVGQFLATFKEFPPRQKAASFSIDQAMEKMKTPDGD